MRSTPRAGACVWEAAIPPPPEASAARERSLLIIVPAFNEEASIGRVVADIRACATHLRETGLRVRVCVIDDGSFD
ncbi:MAG: glycosyltransferase, partial [Acidobacteria bacterium]|nr:glycosyltransferase [Acidobacteriota bacterium]